MSPDPFDPGSLHLAPSRVESEKLNDPDHPCIVISASGMATGGRVLHHLEHQLPRSRNSVILTGYQVPGTRGRSLADGAPNLKIHGSYVPVRAEVVNIRGYSAHADSYDGHRLAQGSPRTPVCVRGARRARLRCRARRHASHSASAGTRWCRRFQERVRID